MSALKVLQSCSTQGKVLLKDIGGIDPSNTNLIIFDLEYHIPRLPPQLAFQLALNCVMSITCWKSIGSPALTESQNTLKYFNGTGFKPYGVLTSLSIMLERKVLNFKVEVFDAPLDYNLLLGCSLIDSMHAFVSTLFHVLHFPHQEKVINVHQPTLFNSDSCTRNIPYISKTPPAYDIFSVGVLKYSTLMGTFPIPPPNIPSLFVA
jgi:hypothetical protein